jgi:hypothetical protein
MQVGIQRLQGVVNVQQRRVKSKWGWAIIFVMRNQTQKSIDVYIFFTLFVFFL